MRGVQRQRYNAPSLIQTYRILSIPLNFARQVPRRCTPPRLLCASIPEYGPRERPRQTLGDPDSSASGLSVLPRAPAAYPGLTLSFARALARPHPRHVGAGEQVAHARHRSAAYFHQDDLERNVAHRLQHDVLGPFRRPKEEPITGPSLRRRMRLLSGWQGTST